MKATSILIFAMILLLSATISCSSDSSKANSPEIKDNKKEFTQRMQKHLDAVTNRDLPSLQSTMHPDGKMQLILQSSEIINEVKGFMAYHREWFQDTSWNFQTKILNTEVGETMGMAVTEVIYSEPDRNGLPYWNRMIVSYDLQKVGGEWYIIKDHASSIEKSTDLID